MPTDNSRKPIFSVVTSFFGEGEKYVSRLYQDIVSQNVDWEWVVTDDFSKDLETEKALRNVASKDPRVVYIDQKGKGEIFRNPQEHARGEFVFHIDADDQVHPNYLEHCYYWFKRFPKVICILSGSEWVKETGHYDRYCLHTNLGLAKEQNYLGRIWRNGFDFEFEKIFSNPQDVIRMNDMFIVRSFEKTGDILCLPRIYIKYEIRGNSNCNVKRNETEIEKIERCKDEFFDWISSNSIFSPYEPFFFDLEKEVLPFIPLSWNNEVKTIEFLGNDLPRYKQRKLSELYPDYKISFQENKAKDPDYKIIDCSGGFKKIEIGGKNTIVLLDLHDQDGFSYYLDCFEKKGKVIRWIKLWDYTWMITLN